MSACVLLNELGEKMRRKALLSTYQFPSPSLINSIIQEHECKILFII